jgi:hypothetical protein
LNTGTESHTTASESFANVGSIGIREGLGRGDYRIAFLQEGRTDRRELHAVSNNLQDPLGSRGKAQTTDHESAHLPQGAAPYFAGIVHLVALSDAERPSRECSIGIDRRVAV